MRIVVIGVLVFAITGCGLLFVEGPPRMIPEDAISVRCTESRLLPTLDVVGAGYIAATPIYLASITDDPFSTEILIPAAIVFSVAGTILYGVSAILGYRKVNSCRDAKDMIEVRNR